MTSGNMPEAKTPDQIVEDNIIASLKEKNLIGEVELKKLQGKIASGSLKADAWKLIFEMTVDQKANKAEASK